MGGNTSKENNCIRGSRVTFTTHKLLDNEGPTLKTKGPITCDSLYQLLDPERYDIDMICEEIATVYPMEINDLFLHTSMVGILRITNENITSSSNDKVVSVHIEQR
jgi:hypothetical protein